MSNACRKSLFQKGFFVGLNLVAWAGALNISSVQYSQYRSLKVPVHLETAQKMANQDVLVDSGATDNFIDPRLLKQLGIGTIPLPAPKKYGTSMKPSTKQENSQITQCSMYTQEDKNYP